MEINCWCFFIDLIESETRIVFISGILCIHHFALFVPLRIEFNPTFEGLKLAAAIGIPKTVNVVNQRPPSRVKKEGGLNSAHEYKVSSFKDEYSLTCVEK